MTSISEKPKNLGEAASEMSTEVMQFYYQFDRRERQIATLKAISKQEW